MRGGESPQPRGGYLERPGPSGLADVIEIILDKGLVIDAYVRVSVVGTKGVIDGVAEELGLSGRRR